MDFCGLETFTDQMTFDIRKGLKITRTIRSGKSPGVVLGVRTWNHRPEIRSLSALAGSSRPSFKLNGEVGWRRNGPVIRMGCNGDHQQIKCFLMSRDSRGIKGFAISCAIVRQERVSSCVAEARQCG